MLVEVLAFLTVALFTAYIILYSVNIYRGPYQGKKAYYDLNKPGQVVLTATDFVWSPKACSIRFVINVEAAPRTVAIVDCISVQNSEATHFAPNCTDYMYRPCKCVGGDCSSCRLDTSKGMSKLVAVGDSLELWASGYTNQNDKPYVPAMLKIRTAKDSSQHYMESIPLPAIPLQQWTAITIVKEGRRFDVYYGAQLQVSKLSEYIPAAPDSTLSWVAGNNGWRGQIGLFKGFDRAASIEDVRKDMGDILNTRGVPTYSEFQWPTLPELPTCIFGNCGGLPDVKPRNPFTVYQTNVA